MTCSNRNKGDTMSKSSMSYWKYFNTGFDIWDPQVFLATKEVFVTTVTFWTYLAPQVHLQKTLQNGGSKKKHWWKLYHTKFSYSNDHFQYDDLNDISEKKFRHCTQRKDILTIIDIYAINEEEYN